MFVRNKTASYQGFSIDKQPFKVAPGGVVALPDDAEKDPTYKILVSRGIVEKVDEKEAMGEIVGEKKEKKSEIPVKDAKDDVKNQVRLVPCVAKKHDGTTCGVNVSVPMDEYDDDKPYFCGHHKNEVAEDYEKVDGKWVKKEKPVEPETHAVAEPPVEPEAEKVEEPATEEPVVEGVKQEEPKAEGPKVEEPAKDEKPAEEKAEEPKKAETKKKTATKSTKAKTTKKNTADSLADQLR